MTGLALDYCVQATALDALKAGFGAVLVEDATQAANPDATQDVLNRLQEAGVQIIKSDCLL